MLHGPAGMRMPVALKVLTGSGEGLQREARLGGLLRHRNLVDVYEVGEADGTWFCAMERCRGGSLEQHRPLPARAIVEVGLQVCDALAYAHDELDLVHLDLKPANLLLDGTTVKVADLGVARARGFAHDGRISGTPRYMAPEQLRGDPVDARTDLFALGRVLADLAVPREQGAASATFTLTDEPAGEVPAPEPPPWLAAIVERCTAPNPADRFASARELQATLAALRCDGPGLAGLVSTEPEALEGTWEEAPPGFVGRTAEQHELAVALASETVVTLRGPGGMGKSRLAAEVVARRDGPAVVVDLAPVADAPGLLEAVARALDVPLGADPVEQLGRALAARDAPCLVLDNVEHLLEAVRPAVARWTRLAPSLRLLLTSRIETGLGRTITLGPLEADDAVALLVARALERGHDISGDPALPELATRLDGVPLALELAAGRVGVLRPAEILARLDLSLLRSAGEGRSATLQATLDWSWGLLSDDDRSALAQLSVFRGGFDVAAAEAVVRTPGWVVDRLTALSDASLLTSTGDGRFGLLETVRQHAAAHLAPAEPCHERHARHFASLAPSPLCSVRVPMEELANFREAAETALRRGDAELALRNALAVVAVYRLRGPREGGADLVQRIRTLPLTPWQRGLAAWLAARSDLPVALREEIADLDDPELLACAEATLADLAVDRSDLDGAAHAIDRALAHAEGLGDAELLALVRVVRGHVSVRRGELAQARDDLARALEWADEAGVDRVRLMALNNLGMVARRGGDEQTARTRFSQARELAASAGDRRSEGIALDNLALLLEQRGRHAEARGFVEASLVIHRETGNLKGQLVALDLLGTAYGREGDLDEARRVLHQVVRLARQADLPLQLGTALRTLADVARAAGEIDEARARLSEAIDVLEAGGDTMWSGVARMELGRLEIDAGDPEQALEILDGAEALLRDRNVPPWLATRAERGRALAALGRRAEAVAELRSVAVGFEESGDVERATFCRDLADALSAG